MELSPSQLASPLSHGASSGRFLSAVRAGAVDEVKSLLEKGEDVNQHDYFGNTALHIACSSGDLLTLQSILSCGQQVSLDAREGVQQRTACHLCASSGHADCLAALLAAGAKADVKNARGETALHKAAQHGRFDCLDVLLASGAEREEKDEHGRTALCRAAQAGSAECCKLLVVGKCNVHTADKAGMTALHWACSKGRAMCCRVLMENGADPQQRDERGRTPADLARESGHEDCAMLVSAWKKGPKREGSEAGGMSAAADGGGAKRGSAVDSWSTHDCAQWCRELSLGDDVASAMEEHKVTGAQLKNLTDMVLKEELGVKAWGTRKRTMEAIEKLLAGIGVAMGAPADQNVAGTRTVLWEELQVGELLGVGNFGEVKRASWRGTDVAVKVIYRKAFHDKDQRQLFHKEVDIISQLHHPNIVQFIGTCATPEGHYCLVTEFCGGGSLRQLIAENSTALLRSNLRNRIARDVCRAMVHLHKWKPPILHRDLTSSNLLLDHALTCKLADFGLSRESYRDRTLTGGFGAVAWMDPDVLRGLPYGTQSDVYAFGMCCFEMVAMQVPHHGHPPLRFAEMACRGHRPRLPASCPADWSTLIHQCWSTDARSRPTFPELLSRIEAMPPQPDPPSSIASPGGSTNTNTTTTTADADEHHISDEAAAIWNKLAGSDGYVN